MEGGGRCAGAGPAAPAVAAWTLDVASKKLIFCQHQHGNRQFMGGHRLSSIDFVFLYTRNIIPENALTKAWSVVIITINSVGLLIYFDIKVSLARHSLHLTCDLVLLLQLKTFFV